MLFSTVKCLENNLTPTSYFELKSKKEFLHISHFMPAADLNSNCCESDLQESMLHVA